MISSQHKKTTLKKTCMPFQSSGVEEEKFGQSGPILLKNPLELQPHATDL